jgi:hypothetical protein
MYIIGENIQEYMNERKAKINNAISQNNFKDAFILFVTSIPYLKDPDLSDFIQYYEEMINRRFSSST